jgi:hypothetical protein
MILLVVKRSVSHQLQASNLEWVNEYVTRHQTELDELTPANWKRFCFFVMA